MLMRGVKIFGIGLSKTGITSLSTALSLLGYRVKKFPLSMEEIDLVDAATDSPVALWFRELDLRYPGSKFIYTTRDKESWLQSCAKMWARQSSYFHSSPFITMLHQELFSTNEFSPKAFSRAYDRHKTAVHSHFANREKALLLLDMAAHQKWETICNFLGIAVPERAWPHENSSEVIAQLVMYLADITGDINLVAELTGISTADIERLQAMAQRQSPFDETILRLDGGWEIRKFASSAIKKYGTPEAAADRCGLSIDTFISLLI